VDSVSTARLLSGLQSAIYVVKQGIGLALARMKAELAAPSQGLEVGHLDHLHPEAVVVVLEEEEEEEEEAILRAVRPMYSSV
jgi:hypothetical protein